MPAPVYPLELPPWPGATEIVWRDNRNAGLPTSELSGHQQGQRRSYALWSAVITLPPMHIDVAGPWIAFFTRLQGKYGTFLMQAPVNHNTLSHAGVTGRHLTEGAWDVPVNFPNNLTGEPVISQFIQLGTGVNAKLYMATAWTPFVGGSTTIEISPELKRAVQVSSPVIVDNPKGNFRLASNISTWEIDRVQKYGITFAIQEAF